MFGVRTVLLSEKRVWKTYRNLRLFPGVNLYFYDGRGMTGEAGLAKVGKSCFNNGGVCECVDSQLGFVAAPGSFGYHGGRLSTLS